jgi:hypothetical protein
MVIENRESPILPISGIIALIAFLGVIIYTQVPLKGKRPDALEVKEQPEKVRARLWQDPFLAVMEHGKNGNAPKSKANSIQDLVSEIKQKEDVAILGVMVSGAPYAEESEWRIRHRYAVLSGLSRLGFIPEDSAHIKYVVNPLADEKTSDTICMSNILPYEWLEKNSEKGKRNILLLWLNDDNFRKKPLSNLADLIHKLPKSSNNSPVGAVKIIGPAGSETLLDMVKELWDGQKTMPKGIQIYSATATAEDSLLIKQLKESSEKAASWLNGHPDIDSVEKVMEKHNITFKRTILSDYELANALFDELHRRGVNFECGQDHIVLIAEWDTIYGRSLPETFETVFKKRSPYFCTDEFESQKKNVKQLYEAIKSDRYHLGTISASKNTFDWLNKVLEVPHLFDQLENEKMPYLTEEIKKLRDQTSEIRKMTFDKLTEEQQISVKRLNRLMIEVSYPDETPKKDEFLKKSVHRFSYLRGIDGKLPGEQDQDSKKQEKKDSANKEDIGSAEQPTGKSQYDYLRRLSAEIYSLDQMLKSEGQGSVRAIGVLGSDFYDKYLVLQALRQRLPEINYFTTDLDARMLHADNIKWTRNLVVASSFGLQLRGDRGDPQHQDLQGDVPPFRDNYQTSIFYATLESFREGKVSLLQDNDDINRESPRIFEIGRKEAFDLTPNHKKNTSIHPQPYIFKVCEKEKRYAKFLLVLFISLFFLIRLSSRRFDQHMKKLWRFIKRHAFVALVALVVLGSLVYLFHYNIVIDPEEEPISILGGVSVWPTEIIRIIVLILSWYFILSAICCLKNNSIKLEEDFGIGGDQTRKASVHLKNEFTYNWRVGDKEETASIDQLWREHMNRGRWNYRLPFTFFILFAYLLVSFSIIYFFGNPTSPVRGDVSSKINTYITILAVASFLTLIFCVFNTTRLCERFVDRASSRAPIWSQSSIKKFMTNASYESEVALGERMLVQLIAGRTDVVGRLIFRPFIVLLLIFVSRNTYFDNWHMSIGLAVVISISMVYAWSSALILRRVAEKARKNVISRLSNKLVTVISEKLPNKEQKERIEFVLNEVRSIQKGAFAPFMKHPAVQALLVPFGGVGGLALVEQLLEKLNV